MNGTLRRFNKTALGLLLSVLACQLSAQVHATVNLGHSLSDVVFTWSADGKLIATGAEDGLVIWDVLTGTILRDLRGRQSDPVKALAWNPNVDSLASASENTIVLWRPSDGSFVKSFSAHANRLLWSPDGQYLAAFNNQGGDVFVYNALGIVLRRLVQDRPNSILVWSPDSKYLLFAGGWGHRTTETDPSPYSKDGWWREGTVWDIETGNKVEEIRPLGNDDTAAPEHMIYQLNSVVWTSDQGRMAAFNVGKQVLIWLEALGRVKTIDITGLFSPDPAAINGAYLVLSPDGRFLAISAVWGCALFLYDLNADTVKRLPVASCSVSWSPDGSRLALDNGASVIDTSGNKLAALPITRSAQPIWVRWTAHGSLVTELESVSPHFRVFNPSSFQSSTFQLDLGQDFNGVTYSGKLLSISLDGKSTVGRISDLDVRTSRELSHAAYNQSLSPDESLLATQNYGDNIVKVFDLRTGSMRWQANDRELLYHRWSGSTWSPDGKSVVLSFKGKLYLHNGSDGGVRQALDGDGSLSGQIYWSPDSKYVAARDSLGSDSATRIWDASNGHLIGTVRPGGDLLGWTPDGKYIIYGWNQDVLVSPPESPDRVLRTLSGVGGASAAWSPNGRLLAIGGLSGSFQIWEGNTWKLLATVYCPDASTWFAFRSDRTFIGEGNLSEYIPLDELTIRQLDTGDAVRARQTVVSGWPQRLAEMDRAARLGGEAGRRKYATDLKSSLSLLLAVQDTEERVRELGLNTLLVAKGRVSEDTAAALDALSRRVEDPDLRRELVDLRSTWAQESAATLTSNNATLRTLNDHEDRLIADLIKRSLEVRDLVAAPTIVDIRARLGSGALVEMVQYNEVYAPERNDKRFGPLHYGAYILTRTGNVLWRDLGLAEQIDVMARRYRYTLTVPGNQAAGKAAAQQLYSLIFEPIRSAAPNVRDFYIAPDGLLRLIPFAALVTKEGVPLIEHYRIRTLSTGRDLARGAPIHSIQPPLAGGLSEFGPPSTGTVFPPIPYARIEASQVAHIMQAPAQELSTQELSKVSFMEKIDGPRILHLATHGYYSGSVGGLALNDANLGPNGILTQQEVAGLRLRGTQLVVLSACESGVGEVSFADGVIGLQRSLTLAGARNQILALWSVNDRVTKDLMVSFYRNLFVKSMTIAESLRHAQLKMARKGIDPSFWAAFVLYGDGGRLAE